eukprot:g1362.t1
MPPKKKGAKEPERPVLLGRASNNLSVGIVGLPNVGKSLLFNVLTKMQQPSSNFAFCTIDPCEAKVPVPDKRFEKLCAAYKPRSEVPAVLTVTDIAGLVRGAAEGAGLGNAFLSHIRAVDAIYHVVRCFDDKNISHVDESVDALRDVITIEEELRKKDVATVAKALDGMDKLVQRGVGGKEKKFEFETLQKLHHVLAEEQKDVRAAPWTAKETVIVNTFHLLTAKPMVYIANLSKKGFMRKNNKYLPGLLEYVQKKGNGELIIPISARYESELLDAQESGEEALKKFMAEHDNTASALPKVIKQGYKTLQMINFFTAGQDEVRAWSIRDGTLAPQAAGVIHTDFEKGFICADVFTFKDWKTAGATMEAEKLIKSQGKVKQQGKAYRMIDGDVVFFKFNN